MRREHLLLSVDSFHQETVPIDVVERFALEAKRCGIPIRLQPAWLVSAVDENPYNIKTRDILDSFADMELPVGEGNVIFPEGNALKYLAEYFTDELPENRMQKIRATCVACRSSQTATFSAVTCMSAILWRLLEITRRKKHNGYTEYKILSKKEIKQWQEEIFLRQYSLEL